MANNIPVSRTDTHKCLGVQIDEKLSWDSHIDMICKKTSAGIGVMRRIKQINQQNVVGMMSM